MRRRRDELAARRRSRGLTQEALAHRLQVGRTTVARWEAGDTTPLPWVRPLLADLLQISSGQLASLLRTDACDPDITATPPPATPAHTAETTSAEDTAAAVRTTSAHIVALDTRSGARHLVDVAVHAAQRAHRTAMSQFQADRDVLAAAAEAQQVAGWVAFDAERQDLSRRMSLEALLSARTAGNRSMEYLALGQLAMQDVHLHQPVEAANLASAALDNGVSGTVRTLFTLRAARAAAQMGEEARARDLLARTRSSFLDGPHQHDPAWAWWLTEAEITWHEAMIEAEGGRWPRAAKRFRAAYQGTGVSTRAAASYRASLLWALAHARAWNEAETVLVRDVLPHRDEVASVRAHRMLARAAQLLDSARARPSLREAARQLTADGSIAHETAGAQLLHTW